MTIIMGVREGRNNFSKLLAYARKGETVIITDSGRPAYQIIAIDSAAAGFQARLNEYQLKGWLEAPGGGQIPEPLELAEYHGLAQRLLQEDREQ